MTIFVLDDEAYLLSTAVRVLQELRPEAEIRPFQRAQAALDCIRNEGVRPDAAFCDIQMPGINGLEFAARLRTLCPAAKVVFVTGYEQYALDAYQLHAQGYVMKPLEPERVAEELAIIEQSLPAPAAAGKKLTVRCFGAFELFWNGAPLSFGRRQTKELFAFLVDKEGANCTPEEISAALWEEEWDLKLTKNRIRVLVSDLRTTLEQIGLGELLIRRSGQIAVRKELLDCDYYRMLEGDKEAIASFGGEYMQQYAWAEPTAGRLYFRYLDA